MPIVDISNVAPTRTIADGANEIRRALAQATNQVDRSLARVRAITTEFGRSNLATELAPDGAELLTLYNALKAVLESDEVGKTVDALPS